MSEPGDLPLLAHLIELRTRLVRIVVVMVVVCLGLWHWARNLYHILALPLLSHLPVGSHMIAVDPLTPVMTPLKVDFLCTFLLTLPHTFYQLWAFVAPGLYAHEKRLVLPLAISSFLLFLCGMAFTYFVVLPTLFTYLPVVIPEGVTMMTDISSYLDFVISMFLAFGGAFEVPIVVVVLVHFGVLSLEKLSALRPYAILAAFVIAGIVTPPDIASQLMLAIPMCLLFEAGLLAARLVRPKSAVQE